MSVELMRYLMARNIHAAEWPTGSRRPLMQSARCGQLAVLDPADRVSLRSVRALRLRVLSLRPLFTWFGVRIFMSETVHPGRFSGITRVIQIAYIRSVNYRHTYTQTYSIYIHTRFNFHQSLEHIVIGY